MGPMLADNTKISGIVENEEGYLRLQWVTGPMGKGTADSLIEINERCFIVVGHTWAGFVQ